MARGRGGALRSAGIASRTVAQRILTFYTLLYAVFLGALVVGGIGLYLGALPGPAPVGATLVPGVIAAALIGLALVVELVPPELDRRLARRRRGGRRRRVSPRLAAVAAVLGGGIRSGLSLLRSRDPQMLGAVGWYGFDASVLWAAFHAFGGSPSVPVVIVSYFIGQLGTLSPLPGGIGGVDGALIGAFSAFGVSGSLAVVAVLTDRAFAFWLPTLPGAVACLQLRRTVNHWQAEGAPAYT